LLYTEAGAFGSSGCSIRRITGSHEAVELRDGDKKTYMGKGVLKALPTLTQKLPLKL